MLWKIKNVIVANKYVVLLQMLTKAEQEKK